MAPSSSKCATVSLPNGYRNWIQGGRASLSGGGPIRFPPSSPLGASVNPARRCGLTTHGRISDCRHGTARTGLATQEGQSSIGCAAALGGVSLELWPGRGASQVSAVPPGPARPPTDFAAPLDYTPPTGRWTGDWTGKRDRTLEDNGGPAGSTTAGPGGSTTRDRTHPQPPHITPPSLWHGSRTSGAGTPQPAPGILAPIHPQMLHSPDIGQAQAAAGHPGRLRAPARLAPAHAQPFTSQITRPMAKGRRAHRLLAQLAAGPADPARGPSSHSTLGRHTPTGVPGPSRQGPGHCQTCP